jgi:hypothetical protein
VRGTDDGSITDDRWAYADLTDALCPPQSLLDIAGCLEYVCHAIDATRAICLDDLIPGCTTSQNEVEWRDESSCAAHSDACRTCRVVDVDEGTALFGRCQGWPDALCLPPPAANGCLLFGNPPCVTRYCSCEPTGLCFVPIFNP